jgi:hypothetical protein
MEMKDRPQLDRGGKRARSEDLVHLILAQLSSSMTVTLLCKDFRISQLRNDSSDRKHNQSESGLLIMALSSLR